MVSAASDYNGLGVYAVRDHHAQTLNLLLINKHPTAALNVNITIRGFKRRASAEVFSYGIPQDEAARTGTGSADVARIDRGRCPARRSPGRRRHTPPR